MRDNPDILFIHTEHHRGDSLGCEGHPVLLTPNMDEIAHTGARFSRFYSACPTCIPARRSILRGQLPQTHGMVGYREGVEWDDVPSLAAVLRDNGYQTADIGRGMHQSPREKRYGFEWMETNFNDYHKWLRDMSPSHGIDDWFSGGVMHNDWTVHPWHLHENLHNTNWTVERALRFMEKRDPSRPLFLSLGFIAAHPPLQPPGFYLERYLRTGVPDAYTGDWAEPSERAELRADSHRIKLPPEAFLCMRAAYYGLINHADDQLRRLINPVKGLRHNRDTIIILTSDHGEMLGDHFLFRKSVPYEGSARVPFLISAPESFGIIKGSVIDIPATHADIMPTLLEMLDISVPDSADGLSLYPALRGEVPENWRSELHIEHSGKMHCLTDGKTKYIWNPADGTEQMFDLSTDPNELYNLARGPEGRERIKSYRGKLVEKLRERPEGFVREGKLVPGRPYKPIIPGSCADAEYK